MNQPQAAGSVAGVFADYNSNAGHPSPFPCNASVLLNCGQLVAKNMHEYKMNALLDLSKVFREAGKPFGDSVFAAGIGNKCTDAVAYRAAGIPPDFIFLIDKESHLQASVFFSSSCLSAPLVVSVMPSFNHRNKKRVTFLRLINWADECRTALPKK